MIKIKNNTLLSYKAIGEVIDKYRKDSIGTALYEGYEDALYFEYKERHYKLTVMYSKRDVKYIFENVKG